MATQNVIHARYIYTYIMYMRAHTPNRTAVHTRTDGIAHFFFLILYTYYIISKDVIIYEHHT